MNLTKEMVFEFLKSVIDPEVGLNIVDMGLVYEVDFFAEGIIGIKMTLTSQGCPMGPYITGEVRKTLEALAGVQGVEIDLVWEPAWTPDMIRPGAMEELQNGGY